MTSLTISHLRKSFGGIAAVAGVSFVCEPGQITSLIGPNGSGKTTLTNLLSGILPFDSGVIIISGVSLRRIRPYDAPAYGITRTFQEVRLFEQMSVLDNLLVVLTERSPVAALFERHVTSHEARAKELLQTVGLWEKRHNLCRNLSYGQRKLLEIARALAMDTPIMLFDEPFAGLFPEMIKTVTGILKDLRTKGKTILLIEHNMELVRELSDRVVVLDAGVVLADGTPDKVLSQKDVLEAYLGD